MTQASINITGMVVNAAEIKESSYRYRYGYGYGYGYGTNKNEKNHKFNGQGTNKEAKTTLS